MTEQDGLEQKNFKAKPSSKSTYQKFSWEGCNTLKGEVRRVKTLLRQIKDDLELSWLSLAHIKLASFIIVNFLYFLWTLQGLYNDFFFLLNDTSIIIFISLCLGVC